MSYLVILRKRTSIKTFPLVAHVHKNLLMGISDSLNRCRSSHIDMKGRKVSGVKEMTTDSRMFLNQVQLWQTQDIFPQLTTRFWQESESFWTQQAVFPLPNSLLWKKTQCCWLPDNSSVCSEAVCIFYSLLKIFVPDPSLHLLFVFPIFIVLLLYHKNFSYSFSVSVFQVYLLLWGSSVWGNQDEQQPSLPPPGSHSITSQLPGRRRYDCLSLLSNRTKDTYICLYRYFTYLIWDTDT